MLQSWHSDFSLLTFVEIQHGRHVTFRHIRNGFHTKIAKYAVVLCQISSGLSVLSGILKEGIPWKQSIVPYVLQCQPRNSWLFRVMFYACDIGAYLWFKIFFPDVLEVLQDARFLIHDRKLETQAKLPFLYVCMFAHLHSGHYFSLFWRYVLFGLFNVLIRNILWRELEVEDID